MAWNGSQKKDGGSTGNSDVRRQPSALKRGLLAGLAVVCGGVVIGFLVLRPRPSAQITSDTGKTGMIADVGTNVVSRVTPDVAKKPKKTPYWLQATTNGLTPVQMRKWWVSQRPPPHFTNDSSRTELPPKYAIFSHRSENAIASYLTAKPGQAMVGTPRYDKKFIDDFIKSCEEPIIVSKDDDEDVRALKKAMNETKIELMARMKDGEDLGKILLDTRKELQNLSQYKRELEKEVREAVKSNPDMSDEDLQDCITAANKMLDAKGIAPIKVGTISKRALMLSMRAKATEEKNKKGVNE